MPEESASVLCASTINANDWPESSDAAYAGGLLAIASVPRRALPRCFGRGNANVNLHRSPQLKRAEFHAGWFGLRPILA